MTALDLLLYAKLLALLAAVAFGSLWWAHRKRVRWAGVPLRFGIASRGVAGGLAFQVTAVDENEEEGRLVMEAPVGAAAEGLELYVADWPPDRPIDAYGRGWKAIVAPPGRVEWNAWGAPRERAEAAAAALQPDQSCPWKILELRDRRVRLTFKRKSPVPPGRLEEYAAGCKAVARQLGGGA